MTARPTSSNEQLIGNSPVTYAKLVDPLSFGTGTGGLISPKASVSPAAPDIAATPIDLRPHDPGTVEVGMTGGHGIAGTAPTTNADEPSTPILQNLTQEIPPAGLEKPEPVPDVTVMPGSEALNIAEIKEISPEGAPGDAKVGPGGMRNLLLTMLVIFAVATVLTGLWQGWRAAAVVGAFAVFTMLINPVVAATLARRRERREVVDARHMPRG